MRTRSRHAARHLAIVLALTASGLAPAAAECGADGRADGARHLASARIAAADGDQAAAAGAFLAAAELGFRAFAACSANGATASEAALEESRRLHAQATAGYVTSHIAAGGRLRNHYRRTPVGGLVVEVADSDFPGDRVVEIVAATDAGGPRLSRRYGRAGVGAPLVVATHSLPGRRSLAEFSVGERDVAPATAVLTFDKPGSNRAVLRLLDSRAREEIKLHGRRHPLAADFTAVVAHLADALGHDPGMLRPGKAMRESGISILEPYDPERTPVLLIHGLRSNPRTWIEMANDLYGSPALRRRYQVWFYSYPSALPYLYAASLLREELESLDQAVRRSARVELRTNPAVVVAHSMGGLIAKALATDSGDRLWSATFTRAADELEGAPVDIERVRSMLIFEPSPLISRIVYVSTPHHGSTMADSFVGRLGAGLTGRLHYLAGSLRRLAEANPDAIRPEMRHRLERGGAKSIGTLSPRHPLLQAFAQLETQVPYHSIIGDRGRRDVRAPERSDGVVSYRSAHLERAASEILVPTGHDAHKQEVTRTEIKVILHQHAWAARRAGTRNGSLPGGD
ncbi:MAG: alpha/beta fold hydrolase [Thermoanaerobaculia bacterium]|nr:alpha/beta fold hydrolase [Thermoanaerobaculia bacterium]